MTILIYAEEAEGGIELGKLTLADLIARRSGLLADEGYPRKGYSFDQDVRRTQWRSRGVFH
jgi:hypothetical protein